MKSGAATVEAYLKALPAERREALQAVRAVLRKHLPKGYEEGMQYGMIGYYVPHRLYPAGYHCDPKQPLPFAGLASQKNHMALYLMGCTGSAEHARWFRAEWAKSGKRLDLGKSCIRFRKLDDLCLRTIGRFVARIPVKKYVAACEAAIRKAGGSR